MIEAGYAEPRFLPAGDAALTVELGNAVAPAINERVLALDAAIADAGIPGVVETIPTYRSLLIQYDPTATDFDTLRAEIARLGVEGRASPTERRWRFPVCYGGDHGVDLDDLANRHGLSPEDAIAVHLAGDYRVYMIGFAPGHAYMSGLDARLAVPRRATPRALVAPGAVAIANEQTVVYPYAISGGWNLNWFRIVRP